jgi:hypothetical protein
MVWISVAGGRNESGGDLDRRHALPAYQTTLERSRGWDSAARRWGRSGDVVNLVADLRMTLAFNPNDP